MNQRTTNPQSAIPSVDKMLRAPMLAEALGMHGRIAVTDAVRTVLASVRRGLMAGEPVETREDAVALQVIAVLKSLAQPSLVRVFNLTGTILHTNLGRAPLPPEAVEAMVAAAGACNLEYDLEKGARGERDTHLEPLLQRLTGAEAATVVNNNAAAVLLVLNSLARDQSVLVSRGELIEIGGAFRIPDIMARAGCYLREVGTTNRTHLKDFSDGIDENTALIMKVHASNYAIEGFTAAPTEVNLAKLAREYELPFVVDLGSGALADLAAYGVPHERTPGETLADGADIVTFSGDKLLGGPQAGLIVGRTDLIEKIRKNPMKRAMRLDKMTIAALEAVLRLYVNPDRLPERLPAVGLLARPVSEIAAVADRMLPLVAQVLNGVAFIETVPCRSQIGSGSLPVDLLESTALSIRPLKEGHSSGDLVNKIAESFRALPAPVIGRVQKGAFLLDLRCLIDEAAFSAQLEKLDLS